MKVYEFEAELFRLEGKMAWTVFYTPYPALEAYGTNGRVNVKATIDGHPFDAVLLPSRNGHYIAFNQAMKAATGKAVGDLVHVKLEPDLAPRTVAIPDEIRAVLDAAGLCAFEALPDYIKREEIRRVMDAKTEETRCKRLEALLAKLGSNTKSR